MKQFSRVTAAVLVIFMMLQACQDKSVQNMPPPSVQVVEVIQEDIPVLEEFVGQTYGLSDIMVQARVDGFLEGIFFEEGRRVRKGQLLYTIATEPYEAKVAAAQGSLAEANTRLVKAESDLEMIKPLAEKKAVSQSDLDAAVAQRDAAVASVDLHHLLVFLVLLWFGRKPSFRRLTLLLPQGSILIGAQHHT